jgi:membrane associated rhomboid family serine protease
MPYSLKYGIFHWFVHFSLAHLLANLIIFLFFGHAGFRLLHLQPYSQIFLFSYLGTTIIDIDHLGVMYKKGVKGLLSSEKIKKYPLHNLASFSVFLFLATVFLTHQQILIGTFFAAIVFHMFWDLFEDIFIFKVNFRKNWL